MPLPFAMVAEQVPLHLLRADPVVTIHEIAIAPPLAAQPDSIHQGQRRQMIGWKL